MSLFLEFNTYHSIQFIKYHCIRFQGTSQFLMLACRYFWNGLNPDNLSPANKWPPYQMFISILSRNIRIDRSMFIPNNIFQILRGLFTLFQFLERRLCNSSNSCVSRIAAVKYYYAWATRWRMFLNLAQILPENQHILAHPFLSEVDFESVLWDNNFQIWWTINHRVIDFPGPRHR